ncbi:MAG: S-layer homology domain-containing protein [Fimbriimonas sp.]
MTRDFGRSYAPYNPPTYSRYELAAALAECLMATEHALDDLVGDDVGPAAEVHARAATSSRMAVRRFVRNHAAIYRLAKEFRGELKELGAPEKWFDRLSSRTTTARVLALEQVDDKTVRALKPEIFRLTEELLLEPFSRGVGHPRPARPLSNWEAAVAVAALFYSANEAVERFDRDAHRLSWDGWGPGVAARMSDLELNRVRIRAFAQNRESIERLRLTFEYELGHLGLDADECRETRNRIVRRSDHGHIPKPGEVYMAFPDVPKVHWAADAVQGMRMAGVLRGYPNGRFGG